jgi:hypothetical protein
VGQEYHSRDDYANFSAEDVKHFQENYEGTSEDFARTMIALAAGSAALAVPLWRKMRSGVWAHLAEGMTIDEMVQAATHDEFEQKDVDREVSRFVIHFYHKNCRD